MTSVQIVCCWFSSRAGPVTDQKRTSKSHGVLMFGFLQKDAERSVVMESVKLVILSRFISRVNSFSDISRKCILVKMNFLLIENEFFQKMKLDGVTSFLDYIYIFLQKVTSIASGYDYSYGYYSYLGLPQYVMIMILIIKDILIVLDCNLAIVVIT